MEVGVFLPRPDFTFCYLLVICFTGKIMSSRLSVPVGLSVCAVESACDCSVQLTAHCLFLTTACQRHHSAVQPAARGFRERQDCEKQQLQQICKAFTNALTFLLLVNRCAQH